MNPILKLYPAFGVPQDYDGPLAKDFHKMVARKFIEGMSGGHTSVVPGATVEGLVRSHLSIDWQFRNGLTFPIRSLDKFHIFDWVRFRIVAIRRWFLTNPYDAIGDDHAAK